MLKKVGPNEGKSLMRGRAAEGKGLASWKKKRGPKKPDSSDRKTRGGKTQKWGDCRGCRRVNADD